MDECVAVAVAEAVAEADQSIREQSIHERAGKNGVFQVSGVRGSQGCPGNYGFFPDFVVRVFAALASGKNGVSQLILEKTGFFIFRA